MIKHIATHDVMEDAMLIRHINKSFLSKLAVNNGRANLMIGFGRAFDMAPPPIRVPPYRASATAPTARDVLCLYSDKMTAEKRLTIHGKRNGKACTAP